MEKGEIERPDTIATLSVPEKYCSGKTVTKKFDITPSKVRVYSLDLCFLATT